MALVAAFAARESSFALSNWVPRFLGDGDDAGKLMFAELFNATASLSWISCRLATNLEEPVYFFLPMLKGR